MIMQMLSNIKEILLFRCAEYSISYIFSEYKYFEKIKTKSHHKADGFLFTPLWLVTPENALMCSAYHKKVSQNYQKTFA